MTRDTGRDPLLTAVASLATVLGVFFVWNAAYVQSAAEGRAFPWDPIITLLQFLCVALPLYFWIGSQKESRLRQWVIPAGVLSFLLLAAVPLVGIKRNNARRWLGLEGTPLVIQPAEFAKLGIEVETRVSDNAQAAAREGNFDVMLWAQHTAPAGDPAFFPNLFLRTGAASNHARFSSPALDAVLDRLAAASDFEARMLIASEAERIVFAEAPVAYLLTPVWHVALSRRLAAYEPWGSDYYVLRADLRLAR